MKIGTEEEFMELIELERNPQNSPCAGDVKVNVTIKLQSFFGQYSDVWLELPEVEMFLIKLQELNQSRSGNATIESMSPNEFSLDIRESEEPGQMEIKTSLQRYQYSGEKQWPTKISGGFHVEPEAIGQLITGMKLLIN